VGLEVPSYNFVPLINFLITFISRILHIAVITERYVMKRRNLFIGLLLVISLAACSSDATLPAPPLDTLASGEFVASCDVTHRLKDDPIVFPRKPGAAHSHDFFGSDTANAFSTVASLRAGTSSCPDRPGDTAAYWTPTLYYGGKTITSRRIRVYYRSGGKDPETIQPFPAGLKIIAGDMSASASHKQPISVASWACTVSGNEKEVQNVPKCSGESLRLKIVFPDCWNGKDLKSSNHKSHMTYSRSGKCPSGWVPVPQITMGFRYWYSDGLGRDPAKVSLSSGNAYNGHADFYNAWNQANLRALVVQCINAARSCGDTGGPQPILAGGSPTPSSPVTNNLLVSTVPERTNPTGLAGGTVESSSKVLVQSSGHTHH
jgi:Domain of unknown function (DUF1996)